MRKLIDNIREFLGMGVSKRDLPEIGDWILLFQPQYPKAGVLGPADRKDRAIIVGEYTGNREDAMDACLSAAASLTLVTGDVVMGSYFVERKAERKTAPP